ncbi:MAG: hypothetical protein AAFZ65_02235 [Planctomycetota bacterium]
MNATPSKRPSHLLLRISAVLWAIWGVVHIFAGVITLRLIFAGDHAEAFHGILPNVEPSTLQLDYPDSVMAVFCQHGMNLAWFGAVTLICAPWIWRGSRSAVLLAALVGGMADLAYFLFIDLGGYALPPGPQMTYICASAIVLGFLGLRLASKKHGA